VSSLDNAAGWQPGCVAIAPNGCEWVAAGGNDYDGATAWRRAYSAVGAALDQVEANTMNRETLIKMIRADGAEDWKSVAQGLEDGAYLKTIGVEDVEMPAVEDAHQHATQMAESHPNHKF